MQLELNIFAHADVGGDDPSFAIVAQGYAGCVIEGLLKWEIEKELAAPLQMWMSCLRPIHETWHASVSKMGRFLLERSLEPGQKEELFGRLLLDLEGGLSDFEFRCAIGSNLPVLYEGLLFRAADGLSLQKTAGKLLISGLGDGIEVAHDGRIKIIETRQAEHRLNDDTGPAIQLDFDACGRFGWDSVIREGLSAISEIHQDYLPWIRRLLRTLVVTPGLVDRTCSGSWADANGTIYMSEPHSPVEVGEVLVHEISHQYFHLASRLASMQKPSEKALYYSPAVGRDRPLDMILIAYHAFANVLTYYERAFSKGLGDQMSENRYVRFTEQVRMLEQHLDGNKGLSELGRIIFETVQRQRTDMEVSLGIAGILSSMQSACALASEAP